VFGSKLKNPTMKLKGKWFGWSLLVPSQFLLLGNSNSIKFRYECSPKVFLEGSYNCSVLTRACVAAAWGHRREKPSAQQEPLGCVGRKPGPSVSRCLWDRALYPELGQGGRIHQD